MREHYANIGLEALCGLFGKSRQAWYQQGKMLIKEQLQTEIVLKQVMEIRKKLPNCGTRKLYYLLKDDFENSGIAIGRDKLFSLLKENNLLVKAKKNYTKTTNSHHWLKKYGDLTSQIELKHSEQLWVSDITYIRLTGAFCYLALITDAYSRKIVGWNLGKTLEADLCVKSLEMALSNRKRNVYLVHHSDRGAQYCSEKYVTLLLNAQAGISMTQNGSPYENALAERINGIVKVEFDCDVVFESFDAAYQAIQTTIEHYNYLRPHGSLNYLTPEKAEHFSGHIEKKWKPRRKKFTVSPP